MVHLLTTTRRKLLTLSMLLAMLVGGVNSAWAETITEDFESVSLTDANGNNLANTWSYGYGLSNGWKVIGGNIYASAGVANYGLWSTAHSGSKSLEASYSSTNSAYVVITKKLSGTFTFWARKTSSSSSTKGKITLYEATESDGTITVSSTQLYPTNESLTTTWTQYEVDLGDEGKYVAINLVRAAIDDIEGTVFEETSSIAKPKDFKVTTMTYNSAALSWTAGGEETAWQLVYGTAGFDKETATPIEINENAYMLTGLSDNTTYEAYLRAKIGDEVSSWTGKLSFTTPMAPISSFPWTEDFNSLTSGIPTGWDNTEGTTTTESYKWTYYSSGHDGAGLRFNSYYNSENNTNFLKTPVFAFGDKTMKLTFWYKNPTGGDFSVYASTDGGATHNIELATGLTGQTDWVQKEIMLPAEFSNKYVVIVFKGTSNCGYGDAYIYLDDVTVKEYSDNAPELAVDTETLDFGKVTAEAEKAVTVTNNGTGQLAVNIASNSEDFQVSPATLEGIAAGESKTFTVTFKYTTGNYGSKTANITVTPTYDETAAVTIAATAIAKDPDVWEEDFEKGSLPTGWEATNWSVGSFSYPSTNDTKIAKAGGYGATIITPRLQANKGDVLVWEALFDWYDEGIKVEYSDDEKASWKVVEVEGLTRATKTTYGKDDITDCYIPNQNNISSRGSKLDMQFVAPADGNYYLRFTSSYSGNGVDNFSGFKLYVPEHDIAKTELNIPATGTQYVEYTATITMKEMAGKNEELTATFYINGTQYGEAVTETLEANGTKTFTVTFTPEEAISGEASFVVENDDVKFKSDKIDVTIAAAPTLDETAGDLNNFANWGSYPVIVLKYSLKAGWNTIILPFAVSDLSVFGEGVKAYSFNGYEGGKLNFNATTSLNAQTPYILYAEKTKSEIVFKNVTQFRNSTEAADLRITTSNGATFQGTYAPMAAGEMEGKWGITTDGHIAKGGAKATLKGFRAYFELPEGATAPVLSLEDGPATSISLNTASAQAEEVYYDLNGRRVEKPTKGLYIINGKKVMVK